MSAASVNDGSVGGPDRDAKAITAANGASFEIHLWEDRTRGELWNPMYDPASLVLVSDEFLPIASSNAVESGRRTFEFRAVAPGRHRLVFEKRMGWKFTPEDRRVFLVGVADGTGLAEAH
ncbi:MAG: protease inhibitor I42 family protein [Nitrospiraceae bacterium]